MHAICIFKYLTPHIYWIWKPGWSLIYPPLAIIFPYLYDFNDGDNSRMHRVYVLNDMFNYVLKASSLRLADEEEGRTEAKREKLSEIWIPQKQPFPSPASTPLRGKTADRKGEIAVIALRPQAPNHEKLRSKTKIIYSNKASRWKHVEKDGERNGEREPANLCT